MNFPRIAALDQLVGIIGARQIETAAARPSDSEPKRQALLALADTKGLSEYLYLYETPGRMLTRTWWHIFLAAPPIRKPGPRTGHGRDRVPRKADYWCPRDRPDRLDGLGSVCGSEPTLERIQVLSSVGE